MFLPVFLILIGWILYLAASGGPQKALWVGWMTVLTLVPVWLVKPMGSLQMDMRTGVAMTVLAAFVLFRGERLTLRWLWLDTLMMMLVATQAISGWGAGEIRPLTIPEITRQWLPAYVMGRLFFRSTVFPGGTGDLDRVLPIMSRLVLVLSLYAIAEAVLRLNLINEILGKHYAVLEAGEGYRWGIKRAQGPLDHPIFFGMMLVMLFPWAMEAGRRARRKVGPRWWLSLPALSLGSVCCTASRGPIIAAVFTVYATLFFRRPKLRLAMVALLLVVSTGVYFGKDAVLKTLTQAAGETEHDGRTIVIGGEDVEYSGTRHRLLLYRVYWDAICHAGAFGYGGRLRGVPIEEHLVQRFSSIDNHYLLFLLQRGYAGIGCFMAVTVCALAYLGKAAWNPKLPHAGLAGALFGGLFAVAFLLQTVWFAPDFAAVWLFCAGLAGSLHSLPQIDDHPAKPDRQHAKPVVSGNLPLQRELVPGHAPIRETFEKG